MSVCRCSLWDEQQHSAVRCGRRALGSFHSTGRSDTQPAEFRVTSPWFWRAWICSFFSLEAVLSYAMCNYSVLSFIIELSEGQLPFLMNGFFCIIGRLVFQFWSGNKKAASLRAEQTASCHWIVILHLSNCCGTKDRGEGNAFSFSIKISSCSLVPNSWVQNLDKICT